MPCAALRLLSAAVRRAARAYTPGGGHGGGAGAGHGDPRLGPDPAIRGYGPHRRAPLLCLQAHALPADLPVSRPQAR